MAPETIRPGLKSRISVTILKAEAGVDVQLELTASNVLGVEMESSGPWPVTNIDTPAGDEASNVPIQLDRVLASTRATILPGKNGIN